MVCIDRVDRRGAQLRCARAPPKNLSRRSGKSSGSSSSTTAAPFATRAATCSVESLRSCKQWARTRPSAWTSVAAAAIWCATRTCASRSPCRWKPPRKTSARLLTSTRATSSSPACGKRNCRAPMTSRAFRRAGARVALTRSPPLSLGPGDCDLLRAMRDDVFPRLRVRVVSSGLHCGGGANTRITPRIQRQRAHAVENLAPPNALFGHEHACPSRPHARSRLPGASRRVLARRQLPVGRADLSARQSAADAAAGDRARQAAPARPLGHDARAELHLRASESRHQQVRPRHDLHRRAGSRRARAGREHLSRRHVQRVLPERVGRHRRAAPAVQAVLVSRRHSQPRRAGNARLDPRRRRARLRAVARLRRGVRQSGSDRRLRHRRRRSGDRTARDQLALEQVSQSGARRRGAADPASERLQDRRPDRARAHSARRADAAAAAATATSRSSSTSRRPSRRRTSRWRARSISIVARIREIQTDARSNGFKQRPRWPALVLHTPKGWTGPSEVDGIAVEDSWRSHQVPLSQLAEKTIASRAAGRMDAQLSTRGAVHQRRQAAAGAARARARRASDAWATTRTPTAACLLRDLRLPDFREYAVAAEAARRRRSPRRRASRALTSATS